MVKKAKTDSLAIFERILGGNLGDNWGKNHRSTIMKFLLILALILLSAYKILLSPILYAFGVRCRHTPSCSLYSSQAMMAHGPWRGGWLTLSRLCRCHPWGSHGIDPVPQSLEPAGWQFWRYGDWAWTQRPESGSEEGSDREEARTTCCKK